MSTTRRRWVGLLTAGVLGLTLSACSDDTSGDGASTTEQAVAAATEAEEGEEITIEEFLALLQSPGEETLSSYTLSLAMTMGGQELDMQGLVDLSGDDPEMDITMAMPGMGDVRLIMTEGRVFVSMPGVTEEGRFTEIPEEQLGELATEIQEVDIRATWETWEEGANRVTYVGTDDVDGQDMRHYEVAVDTEVALDSLGQTGDAAAEASAALGDEITYDVWVDEDGLMRKVTFESEGVVTEMTADNWGEPQDIEAPPADVVDQLQGGQTEEP